VICLDAILRRFHRVRRGEEGYSLPELLVAVFVGTIVLGGLFMLVNFTVRANSRTTSRVAVDQIARPAMQRIVDELNSTCVYPGLAPVQAGSTGQQLSMIHATGNAANPAPVLRRITFNGGTGGNPGTLIDYTYRTNGGTAPNWTFSSSIDQQFRLLNRVFQIKTGPTTYTPIFRYYRYVNGAISPTPLPTPLTVDSAKLVVQVTVAFRVSLSQGADAIDDGSASDYTGSALLRFSPSNEDTNKAGLPCT
jgi:hypothetical protein